MQESTENHSKPQGYYSTGSLFNDVTSKHTPKHSKSFQNIKKLQKIFQIDSKQSITFQKIPNKH
jgi:hypothetical protein